jgi:hypothetical protein
MTHTFGSLGARYTVEQSQEPRGYAITIAGQRHLVPTTYSDSLCTFIQNNLVIEPGDEVQHLATDTCLDPAQAEQIEFFEVEPNDSVEWHSFRPGVPQMRSFGHGDGGYHYLEKQYLVETYQPRNQIQFELPLPNFGVDESYNVTCNTEAVIQLIHDITVRIQTELDIQATFRGVRGRINDYYSVPTLYFECAEPSQAQNIACQLGHNQNQIDRLQAQFTELQERVQEESREQAQKLGHLHYEYLEDDDYECLEDENA